MDLKATGIVRRIDELGRVVIPKEIRRTLRIREGDPLEIFTDRDGEIILKKYSPIGEMSDFAQEFTLALNQTYGLQAAICDKDIVIAAAGASKKEWMDKAISGELERCIKTRQARLFAFADGNMTSVIRAGESTDRLLNLYAAPVVVLGDGIGAVILAGKSDGEAIDPAAMRSADMVATFLSKLMEQTS